MKYFIDLTSLADNLSGIERYALCITQNMLRQDRRNKYLLVFKNEIHKSFKEFEGYGNIDFKVLKGRNKLIFNQVILTAFLLRSKADRYFFFAFPSPVLFRQKGIYNTIHDMGAWDVPRTMKTLSRIYFMVSYWHAAKISRGIITVSSFSKRRIATILKYPPERIYVVPSAVSENFRGMENLAKENFVAIRKKYHLPDHYIMCLSTLEPRKNMTLLLNAYSRLVQMRKADFDLVLVGRKGWKIDGLLDHAKLLSGKVHFTGFVEDEDIPYIYQQAICFIFPSIYEGFGLPPLEALSMNVPVISSDAASLPEILGEQAVYFHSGDEKDLEEKLERLDSVLQGRYWGLSQFQKKSFNFSASARKILNIISEQN